MFLLSSALAAEGKKIINVYVHNNKIPETEYDKVYNGTGILFKYPVDLEYVMSDIA